MTSIPSLRWLMMLRISGWVRVLFGDQFVCNAGIRSPMSSKAQWACGLLHLRSPHKNIHPLRISRKFLCQDAVRVPFPSRPAAFVDLLVFVGRSPSYCERFLLVIVLLMGGIECRHPNRLRMFGKLANSRWKLSLRTIWHLTKP